VAKFTYGIPPRLEIKLVGELSSDKGGVHIRVVLHDGKNSSVFQLEDGPFDLHEAPQKFEELLRNMQRDHSFVQVH
jgi:hypothetical protein